MSKHACQEEKEEKTMLADEASRGRLLMDLLRQFWPVLFGSIILWYEFAVFGYLSRQMTANFFPGSVAATWFTFAVTFASRPFGGFVVGWLADRFGRRHSTVLSLLGMLVATVGQGLLPAFPCCGDTGRLGVILLVACRILQGVFTGGDEAAICPYVAETAPHKIRCLAVSVFTVTITLGFLLASGVVFLLSLCLDAEAMTLWGWRLPFLIVLVPGSISLWGRRHLPESPEFLAWQEQQAARSEETSESLGFIAAATAALREHGASLAVAFFGIAQTLLVFYSAIWCIAHARRHGLPESTGMAIGSLMQAVSMAVIITFATISDMRGKGPQPTFLIANVCALIGMLPLYILVLTYPGNTTIVGFCVCLGFGILIGLQNSTCIAFALDLFPTGMRGKLFGTAMNLGVGVWGGCAGLVAEKLLSLSPHGPVFYTTGVGLISCATLAIAVWAHSRKFMDIQRLSGLVPVVAIAPRGNVPATLEV